MIFSPSVVQRTNRRLFYRAKVLKLAVCHASVQSGFSTSLRHGDFVTRLSRFTNRCVSTMKMRNENIRCNVMSQMNIFIFYIDLYTDHSNVTLVISVAWIQAFWFVSGSAVGVQRVEPLVFGWFPWMARQMKKRQNIENLGYTEGEESKSDGYKNFTD